MPGATWASVAAEGVCAGLAFFFGFFFPRKLLACFAIQVRLQLMPKKPQPHPAQSTTNKREQSAWREKCPEKLQEGELRPVPFATWTTRERCQICISGGTPSRDRQGLQRAEGREGKEEGAPLSQGRIRLHTASAGRRGNVGGCSEVPVCAHAHGAGRTDTQTLHTPPRVGAEQLCEWGVRRCVCSVCTRVRPAGYLFVCTRVTHAGRCVFVCLNERERQE